MDFNFFIPLNRDDLLQPDDNNYIVNDVCAPAELPGKLQACQVAHKQDGVSFILKNFDILYSVLQHFEKISPELREDAWEIIFSAVAQHGSELCLLLDDSNDLESEMKRCHLNILKMLTYLLCQITELCEADATKPSTEIVVNAGKTKRKQGTKRNSEDVNNSWDWEALRNKCIHCLYQLCLLPLSKLFDPPVVEEEFVNLICNCCYKLLENPVVGRSKTTKDSIFQLLGINIKKYNHSTGCTLKIIQLLRHFDHLISPLAYGVGIFVNNYGATAIISDVIREIGYIDGNDLARDNSETRSFSQFIVEIAQQMPMLVLPTISLLLPHLNGDAYSMRNCVLEVMGEIVLKVLSEDNLDEKLHKLRNELLDKLEDHVHDTNAFVRCRTIQIWNRLCTEKVIPLPQQQKVLSLLVGRLQDKSSSVRKNSIQAVTTFLQSNPFAAKLSCEELQESLKREKKKLEELTSSQSSEEICIDGNPQETWLAIKPQVTGLLEEMLNNQIENETQDSDMSDSLLTEVLKQIKDLLVENQLYDGIRLLQKTIRMWPDYSLFICDTHARDQCEKDNQSNGEEGKSEVESQSPDEESQTTCKLSSVQLIEILKKIYCGKFSDQSDEANPGKDKLKLQEVTEKMMHDVSQELEKSREELVTGGIVFNELNKQKILVQCLEDCVLFASQVNQAIPTVCRLLGSKTNSDVLEAIEFFVIAFEFGVHGALIGIRKMLLLIWSKETGIKEAVVGAYKRLYLNSGGQNERVKALGIVKNLTQLMENLTLGESTSLEELISEFMKSKDLSKQVIQVLWERFSLKLPETSEKESSAALQLLSMAARAEVAIIGSNVDVLIAVGLGTRAKKDFSLVRDTCIAFLKLSVPTKTESAQEPTRFPENHDILVRLSEILVEGVTKTDDQNWTPMAEQAITAIYKLAENPDFICSNLIRRLAAVVLSNYRKENDEKAELPTQELFLSEVLSRIIFLIGQVALNQLIHLELNIACELKRRHFLKEEKANEKNKCKGFATARPSLSIITPRNMNKPASMEEEMGLTGAVADDAEAEYLRKVCDSEIVTGTNMLSLIAPVIIHVCSNPSKFKCVKLRAAAALSLAKFTLVSTEFCEKNLSLLFTILEKSPEALIRANTIIALGDLSFRFPNLVEPWTPHLYYRLRDESVHVRKNTLMVLTHLILNDMIKVKGQISDMAVCIIDADFRISGLAKLFFTELSQKGNTVYNILPDIISRLSDPECGVSEEDFKAILEYLFSFIQKDRQVECLVEKLCHRFRSTQTARQWRDIAFCLSLLSYSERCVKKLQENFSCFSDKLGEDFVYNCFATILNSAKKLTKIDSKVLLDELEEKIEEARQKGIGENQLLEKAQIAKFGNIIKQESKTSPEPVACASTEDSFENGFKNLKSQVKDEPGKNQHPMSDSDDFSPVKHMKKRQSSRKAGHVTFDSDLEEINPEHSVVSGDGDQGLTTETKRIGRRNSKTPAKNGLANKNKATGKILKTPAAKLKRLSKRNSRSSDVAVISEGSESDAVKRRSSRKSKIIDNSIITEVCPERSTVESTPFKTPGKKLLESVTPLRRSSRRKNVS